MICVKIMPLNATFNKCNLYIKIKQFLVVYIKCNN